MTVLFNIDRNAHSLSQGLQVPLAANIIQVETVLINVTLVKPLPILCRPDTLHIEPSTNFDPVRV
jgi:hypothetical protein